MEQIKGSIFINYRKDDSNWNALALYNELQKYFSKDQIFKDFNAIAPGDDFVDSINSALHSCDVLLVLIGKTWLDIKGEDGTRRLDDPTDFVRLEIAKALERNIKVVPVMLDRTPMPKTHELPENMQALSRRQFIEVDPTRFEDDINNLAEAIHRILKEKGRDIPDPPKPAPAPNPTPTPAPNPQPYIPKPQPVANVGGTMPPKPDNNLIWGILTTILCCFPLGIPSIIFANKVDSLYAQGQYTQAAESAAQAKKFAIWALIAGVISWILLMIYGASLDQANLNAN